MHQINYICRLQAQGKISQLEAYNQIEVLFKALERSKQELRIHKNPDQ